MDTHRALDETTSVAKGGTMTDWDYLTDLLVVGSGGGLAAALAAATEGFDSLVIEKEDAVGGSTGMSGGVMWLPHNPLMADEGVVDSLELGLEYFDSVVGAPTPASSLERRTAFIEQGAAMVRLLQDEGVHFVRCEGYSDYYAGVPGYRGGLARGRAIECDIFDGRELGPLLPKLRAAFAGGMIILTGEASKAQVMFRSIDGLRFAAKVAWRSVGARLKGEVRLTNGAALVASLLKVLIARSIPLWTGTSLVDLLLEDGQVVGAVVNRGGKQIRVRTRGGVLLNAGGFAHNREMREKYSGGQPNSAEWSHSNPGDTGEVIELAIKVGADTDLMDEAWWIPTTILPDGTRTFVHGERSKPGCIIVDSNGSRYFNETVSYMEAGQRMYQRDKTVGAVPSWFIMDGRFMRRYPIGFKPPMYVPKGWLQSGFLVKADNLADLAASCDMDEGVLRSTVERFNGFAAVGTDDDFHRGEGDHERFWGDATNKPNPCLGPIDKPPFYAIRLYPGDVGTSGGLLCDQYSRVLDKGGDPIPGLYASGNSTASVMGRTYPGAGASIGASMVFAYIASKHATTRAADDASPTGS
jgi:3-oxosteroid 1-dehydrogenase